MGRGRGAACSSHIPAAGLEGFQKPGKGSKGGPVLPPTFIHTFLGIPVCPFLLLSPGALCSGNSLVDLESANTGYLGNTS